MTLPDPAAVFAALRPRLVRIAYRMLGSVADAEDVVQDSYLRWQGQDHEAIESPEAWLVRTVSRRALDHLNAARHRRETYLGPWLPEPVIDPDDGAETADEVTLSLMLVLERLSPLERAAFLLHDVFDLGFDEIARIIEREPAACRQLASRARAHVRAARPRFPVSQEHGRKLAAAFVAASSTGDIPGLSRLLAADVVLYSDGGGKVAAALNPILGADHVGRFFAGIARKHGVPAPESIQYVTIDGLPGYVLLGEEGAVQAAALEVVDDRIVAIYAVRNPDKLRHLVLHASG